MTGAAPRTRADWYAKNVGFIGPGRMGRPMIDRLVAAGHKLTVFAHQRDTRAADITGLRWTDSLSETVRGADVVISVVRTDEQLRTVCLGAGGALLSMRPGATLVQHTTCDPATVELIAREAAERDIHVLDAALSGGPHDVAAGTLTLWVGGEEAVLASLRALLATYASPLLYVGPVGNGQRIKLVNNALFVAQVGLAIDAVRLAGELGIGEQAILSALQHGSGASRALSVAARSGSVDTLPARIGELMRKDLDVVLQVAQRVRADLGAIGGVLSSDAVQKKVLGSGPGDDEA